MCAIEPVQSPKSRTPSHKLAKELEPEQFVAAIAADPSLLNSPQLRQRYEIC